MTSIALSSGIAAYWPLLLAGICGIVLVMIALLALMLLKGTNDLPATWKLLHAVREKKQGREETPANLPVNVYFYRIGRDGEFKKVSLSPHKWCTVGSGEKADFCLDADDQKLEEKHFRICIKDGQLSVAPMEWEIFVNGVPTQKLGTVRIRNGELIRAGSHEYRVIFSAGEEKESAT